MTTASAISSNVLASAFIAEIEQEAKVTREILSRIPIDKFDWKPHEKSMSFGKLASHVAEMFGWTPATLTQSELDFSKIDYKPFEPQTTDQLVEFLDKHVAEAIDTLRNATDEQFMEMWSMRNGETIYFTLPKAVVMRSMVMNHIVHHRGQLSVYLRLNDISVPSIYGPSADEGSM
jgi:uncharacterized damage-inducible protein DinB